MSFEEDQAIYAEERTRDIYRLWKMGYRRRDIAKMLRMGVTGVRRRIDHFKRLESEGKTYEL